MFEYIFGIDNVVPLDKWLDFRAIILQGCFSGAFLEVIVFLLDPYY